MKNTIQAVKGTRDFYPEEMATISFLYETAQKVSESFGYQEWDGPILETIDLYAAKSGEELVKEQSFVFEDRGGDMITLRPELTPSLARLVAQRQRQLVYPLRWWSWGPFWRYERPQKGRTREFFQWNIDLIGVDTPEADAEMVAIAASFLRETGLTPQQVNILVNNRRLMDSELQTLGISADNRQNVFRLIDRRDKMSPESWASYAEELGISSQQFEGLKAILADENLWRKSEELVRFFATLEKMGISEYVHFAPHIIRGLDYYTGTVFEVWDLKGEFRAILGGGRYDNLVADVGGDPLSAVGFAMGDLVVSLVLKKYGCLPETAGKSPAPILVTVFDQSTIANSFKLATDLRKAGLNVACYPAPAKLGKQFKFGDRMGMRLALVLGPDELANETVAIKDLSSGVQQNIPIAEIEKAVRELLASNPAS
jgi:histidyl-tRNA synthetase